MQYAEAEVIEEPAYLTIRGSDENRGIFIANNGISNVIIWQSDAGISTNFDSKVKTYKSGSFSMKNAESGIVVFAHLEKDKQQYSLVVLTAEGIYRFIGIPEILGGLEEEPINGTRIEPKSSVGSDITKWNIPTDTTRGGPTGTGKQLQIMVKADYVKSIFLSEEYDPNISVVNYWNPNDKIKDAKVHLEILRDGSIIRDIAGTTSSNGKWNPAVKVLYPTFYPGLCYDVKITAQYGNQTDTMYDDFLVLTTAKYWKSNDDDSSLSRDKIKSDYDCNDKD